MTMPPSANSACATKLLSLLLLLTVPAQAQFVYMTNWGTITIVRYTGSGGAVAIPSTTNGLPVTGIRAGAFFNCTSVTSVAIPKSVTSIESDAFPGCTSLIAITVDALNTSYSSLSGVLFNKNQTMLIRCPGGKSGSYGIPAGVTNVGSYAFYLCRSLTGVSIPGSVTTIGNDAFHQCVDLTSITIPSSVTNIGSGAFYQCLGLSGITVDELNPAYSSVAGVLFNKSQTVLIEFPGGKSGSYTVLNGVRSIGAWAFYNCSSLTHVTIPMSVTSIGDGAFDTCSSLRIVTIPNSITNIGSSLFAHTALTDITIPNSVTSIGDDAFFACYWLTRATIPNSVTNIGDDAYYHCESLANVMIGNSVRSIGDDAFDSCSSLTSVYCLGNAASCGSWVFANDTNATVYYLPGTTGWGATFGGCPTVLWNPQAQTGDGSFGVRTNRFGFNITGSSNLVIVVEACTNAANPTWSSVSTNTLSGGSSYFSDPRWTNYTRRFYRLRSP
jgi:hypothetical protein